MVVNLRDGADAESDDTDACDQSKYNERLMGDGKRGVLDRELTNEHDPTIADPTDKAAISEALNEQGEREATPSADKVPRKLPEEDSDGSTSATRYSACQNEETSEGLTWWVDLVQHAKFEDEHKAH